MLDDFLSMALAPNFDVPWVRGKAARGQLTVPFGSGGEPVKMLVEFRIPGTRARQNGIVVARTPETLYVARANREDPTAIPFDFGKMLSLVGGYSISSEIWVGKPRLFKKSGLHAKDRDMAKLEALIASTPPSPFL